ncbi:MAG: cytochrome c oxidase assembly protein [Acidimicrobiia bacterium]
MSLGELIAWRPHPEVWILVVTLVGGYWWAVRRLAPYYVSKGQPGVSRLQVAAYLAGVGAVWAVLDWALHDIVEEALLSIHMVERLALVLIVPPPIILGVPGWLWRVLLDPVLPLVRRITHSMVGLLISNTVSPRHIGRP